MSTQPPNPYGTPPEQFNQEPSYNQQMASGPPTPYPAQYGAPEGLVVGQSNSPTIALVCGIVATIALVCGIVAAGIFTAIPAVIYGIKGRREALEGRTPNRGMATAGMWLGIVNLAVTAIVIGFFLVAFISLGSAGVATTTQPGL